MSQVAIEQLPEIAETYDLPPASIETYRENGHVKLEGVFSRDEIEAYRRHLKRVVEDNYAQSHGMEQKVAGAGKNWMFVNNLWALDDAARRFVMSRRLGRLAADLLEVDGVRLFRDQSYFKGPGGANTPWHQDAYFMPLDTEKILTLWIPLTDITPELAPMSYFTGSHAKGYLGTSNGDDESMDRFEEQLGEQGYEMFNYGTFEAGDLAAHSAWTLHSSRSNTAPLIREAMVIVYFADGARLAEEPALTPKSSPQEFYARLIRKQNRETSLPGLAPGDLAAGEMAPLIYSRAQESS